MSKPKQTIRGFVVDHKESKARYAVSPQNFDSKVHVKIRELHPHETVNGFQPRRVSKATAEAVPTPQTPALAGDPNTK